MIFARLMTTEEAADFLGLSKSTLEHWRTVRTGPPFVRVGARSIRYRLEDLEAWLVEQTVETKK